MQVAELSSIYLNSSDVKIVPLGNGEWPSPTGAFFGDMIQVANVPDSDLH